jgi:hypothetical protein
MKVTKPSPIVYLLMGAICTHQETKEEKIIDSMSINGKVIGFEWDKNEISFEELVSNYFIRARGNQEYCVMNLKHVSSYDARIKDYMWCLCTEEIENAYPLEPILMLGDF